MENQERFERLVSELEVFIGDEAVALKEENWDYLAEILEKKTGHLKAMKALESMVNFAMGNLKVRLDALKAQETTNAKTLADKMAEVKGVRDELDEGSRRIKKIKAYSTGTRVPFQVGKDAQGRFNTNA